jgi:ssDNA-binding Zn-finger/Zn-ribbon topoisomerase 1
MKQLEICPECKQPLVMMNFNSHRIWVCDNDKCHSFRRHKVIELKTGFNQHGNQDYSISTQEHYRILRNKNKEEYANRI